MKKINKKVVIPCILVLGIGCASGVYYCTHKDSVTVATNQNTATNNATVTSDGTVTFTLYDDDGNEEKVVTTWQEIEENDETKAKWKKYEEAVAPSSEEEIKAVATQTEENSKTTARPEKDPALAEDVVLTTDNYSTEDGSMGVEKCEKLLKKAKVYYDKMKNGEIGENEYFIECYKKLKKTYSEQNYYALKNDLKGITGEMQE